jgi:hypothetical protein
MRVALRSGCTRLAGPRSPRQRDERLSSIGAVSPAPGRTSASSVPALPGSSRPRLTRRLTLALVRAGEAAGLMPTSSETPAGRPTSGLDRDLRRDRNRHPRDALASATARAAGGTAGSPDGEELQRRALEDHPVLSTSLATATAPRARLATRNTPSLERVRSMRAVACLCFREGWERGERRSHADDAQQRRFVAARLLWLGRRTPSLAGTRRIE